MEAKQRVATDSSGSFVFEHKHGYRNVLCSLMVLCRFSVIQVITGDSSDPNLFHMLTCSTSHLIAS